MRNVDEIEAIRPLARVAPGEHGGEPSGAGARALLASITAEEPGTARDRGMASGGRRFRPRRVLIGLAASAALAAGVVVAPIVLKDGVPSSYAVILDDGMVTIQIRDFDDAAGLERRLKELGVPARVDHVAKGMMCREPRGTQVVDNIPRGLYSLPENIPGESEGWQMRINSKLFGPDQTFVWTISGKGGMTSTILYEGPVAPCEPVPAPTPRQIKPEFRVATDKGRSLEGLRVDEKTVGEVLPELKRRGKQVIFAIISVPPGNPGGYGIDRTQKEPVGDGWVVWEAEENAKGVIRLLVTEDRLDKNPVYGGPRDAVIKD
ncbi:hypothetical protein ACIBIZ_13870 [Nonomuraea spiralis]|uniref:hypothetical protein n=1 Tax=Nonomuraea TaxID=83681 RepID=UPI000F79A999|nr:hypothetical protein [Nonomuraea sp. WAC 01424]RSN11614.1 hypothetical protein DMB42_13635 [Nonomuraea sp. WAC 01424]